MVKIIYYESYTDSRDYIGCEIIFISAFGIAATINDIFKLNLGRRLLNLQKKREDLQASRGK